MIDFGSLDNGKATGKEWHGRSYPKYDSAIHIPILKEIFGNGGGVAAFLSACQISKVTFYEWIKKYEEFNTQYELSLSEGKAAWELMPLELAKSGRSIPYAYWIMMMRQRYKEIPIQLQEAEKDTTESRTKAAWKSLRDGGITPQEYNQIASGLATESRIAEVELKKEELDHVKESDKLSAEMTDEALRAYMLVKSGKGKVIAIDDE
jgi:hypothetical protein